MSEFRKDPRSLGIEDDDERPLDQAVLDVQAARLRARRLTYQQVADELGIPLTTAYDRVQRVYKAAKVEATEMARHMERERLDALWQRAEEIATREHYVVAHGKVVIDDLGHPIVDDAPVIAARREQRMIAESYRKLEGLDAPTKVEQSGGVTYSIVGVDPADLT